MRLVVPAVYEESFLDATATDSGLRANSDLPSISDDASPTMSPTGRALPSSNRPSA